MMRFNKKKQTIFSQAIWSLFFFAILGIFIIHVQESISLTTNPVPMLTTFTTSSSDPMMSQYAIILDAITLLITAVCALIIFRHRPNDPATILTSIIVLFGGFLYNSVSLESSTPPPLLALLGTLGEMSLAVLVLYFPFSRNRFQWFWLCIIPLCIWRFIVWMTSILPAYEILRLRGEFNLIHHDPLSTSLLFIVFVLFLCTKLYFTRNKLTIVQRQQVKWLLLSMLIAVVSLMDYYFLFHVLTDLQELEAHDLLAQILTQTTLHIALLQFPILITMATLQYRLWDADRLISRVISYFLLIAIMTFTYWVSTAGLRSVLIALHNRSTLANSGATLIVTLLFHPLRTRLQRTIDRYIYPHAYDALQLVEEFGQKLRQETDLDHIVQQLSEVVDDTMQPTHISIWLRPQPKRKITKRLRPEPDQSEQP